MIKKHYNLIIILILVAGFTLISPAKVFSDGASPGADVDIKEYAKVVGSATSTWQESLSVSPSSTVDFKIEIISSSSSSSTLSNLMVKYNIPNKMIYKDGLILNGNRDGRDISKQAINIGSLAPGEKTVITYRTQVLGTSSFSSTNEDIINTVLLYNSDISRSDTLKITVKREAVAGVSTGVFDEPLMRSILFPLFISLLFVWFFRSQLVGIDKIFERRKRDVKKFRAKKSLDEKIKRFKERGEV